MKLKIYLTLLVFIFLTSNIAFAMGPRFRDEFYIENRTSSRLLLVLENIGEDVSTACFIHIPYDNEDILLTIPAANDSKIFFRTIEPGKIFEIGYTMYDRPESFNELTPLEKFKICFKFILFFDEAGNLKYRIDDFSQYKIESIPGYIPGVFVLIIE
ncbi:hypothetical protein FACS1894130_02950 [Spirochaetia bacterium]|nr:hypothetical protein FACS1894130_02950 [Spirochaetia bacterium]